ncbi:unnamed protein product [Sphagnum jensenii]|uniref:Peptidase A1 domain-containing protein n=1 Tax=Sphagnum jensenii TaxID=128206 RepID=A0ABP0XJB6_9BRYO
MEGSPGAAPGAIRRSSSDGGYKGRLTVPAGLGIAAAGAARVLLVQSLVLIAFFAFVDRAVGIISVETSHQVHTGQMQVDVKFQGSQRQHLHLQAHEDTVDVLEHPKVNVVQHSSRGETVMTIQSSNGRQLSSRSSSYESLARRVWCGIIHLGRIGAQRCSQLTFQKILWQLVHYVSRGFAQRDAETRYCSRADFDDASSSWFFFDQLEFDNYSRDEVSKWIIIDCAKSRAMGTPPREVLATVDTGSEMFWLQCKPCQDCYNQTGPIFNPARSSSFRTLPCSSPVCKVNYLQCSNNNSSSRSNNTSATSAPRVCVYTVGYGDGSVSQGNLAEDTLVLKSASTGKPYYITGFAFGCSHINKGLFAGSAGILGLGRGKLSLPSQLLMIQGASAAIATNRFSYCLTDRFRNPDASSYIRFGTEAGARQLQYISMLKNPQMPVLYYVKLTGVAVGTELKLEFPASLYQVDGNGNGGVIFDSGTSITRLAEPAYSHLRDAFRTATAHLRRVEVDDGLFDTCYSLSHNQSQLLATIPVVTLYFDDKVRMPLPIDNTVLAIDSKGTFCLAFATAGAPGNVSIVGNVQQQNFKVEYDLTNNKIGFAPTDCGDQDQD